MSKLSEAQQDQVREMHKDGKDAKEIVAYVGENYGIKISDGTVYNICKGVKKNKGALRGKKKSRAKVKGISASVTDRPKDTRSLQELAASVEALACDIPKQCRDVLLRTEESLKDAQLALITTTE
jgi:actin-like ATPase involved in cell morphogenesis